MLGFCGWFGPDADDNRVFEAITRQSRPAGRPWRGAGAAVAAHAATTSTVDRTERQPVRCAGGRHVLAFQGRLDNRDELIAALGIERKAAEGLGDAGLVAALVERNGPDVAGRLLGDFALCLWDTERRDLRLIRDPLGLQTLYYAPLPHGDVVVASELPTLLALPDVPRELDPQQLTYLLAVHNDPERRTIYRGVSAAPAGGTALFREVGRAAAAPAVTFYWKLDPARRLRLADDRDYVAAADELLGQAVACRLRGDRKLAATISGGLDSSLVAATAAPLLAPRRLPVYCCVPADATGFSSHPKGYPDESEKVRLIAAATPNLDLRLVASSRNHRLDPAAIFARLGEPVLTFPNLEWFDPLYRAMAADGAQAALNGNPGNLGLSFNGVLGVNDFLPGLGGYRFGDRGPWTLLRLLNRYAAARGEKSLSLLYHEIAGPRVPLRLREWRQYRRHGEPAWAAYASLSQQAADDSALDLLARRGDYDPYYLHGTDSRRLRVRVLARQAHRVGPTAAVERLLYGIEPRSPLADVRLLEFCLAIPTEQHMLDGTPRSLARRLAADRLPKAVAADFRHGVQDPQRLSRLTPRLDEWRADLDRIERSSLASYLLDAKRLRRLIDTWPSPKEYTAQAVPLAYHLALPRAMHVGQFILWSERQNAPPV
jgi:asparagine synthase (glutamine-hydrolysing)